jgi:hypothetical protein
MSVSPLPDLLVEIMCHLRAYSYYETRQGDVSARVVRAEKLHLRFALKNREKNQHETNMVKI